MSDTKASIPGLSCLAAFLALRVDAASGPLSDDDDELLWRVHQMLNRIAQADGRVRIAVNRRARLSWNDQWHPVCVSALGLGEVEVTTAAKLDARQRVKLVIDGPASGRRYRFKGTVASTTGDGHCALIRLEYWLGTGRDA